MAPTADPRPWLTSVRRSHDRLTAQVGTLDVADLDRPSYCSDWSVAQVLSHLGSQAEIFSRFVEAGLTGGEAPAQDDFVSIWDSWNARTPGAQAADCVAANESFVALLERLGPEQLAAFRLAAFGHELDVAALLRMRLSEHAVHTWDVAVAFDPAARVAADAVELLVDAVPDTAHRPGEPASSPAVLAVTTTAPARRFRLLTGGVELQPADGDGDGEVAGADGSVRLPAEALVRLVYGRLDDAGGVALEGVGFDELAALFPGF